MLMKKFVIFAIAALAACSCGTLASSGSSSSSRSYSSSASGALGIRVSKSGNTEYVTITNLPTSASDLSGADITDPYVTAALTVAALMQYESNNAACMEMLEYLNGPNSISQYETQFLRDRLKGKWSPEWTGMIYRSRIGCSGKRNICFSIRTFIWLGQGCVSLMKTVFMA